ncbi:hypothetical protein [Xanthomarina gelatinilytica]|uniref:hypothetical protein n=1 Tax=Xanthomarina gelatinilytica TaxID=1137281 RepID=UPI003AA82C11
MKKPLTLLILKTIFLLFISSLILTYIYKLNSHEREFENNGINNQFLNLGNSHGNFLKYKVFGLKGINAFKPGSSPYYFNSLYKHYKKSLDNDAIIIIPISYHSFGIDTGKEEESSFNNQFYSFLEPKLIRNYKLSKHVDIININLSNNIKSLLLGEKLKIENKHNDTIKFLFNAYAKNMAYDYKIAANEISSKADFFADKHKKLFNSANVRFNLDQLSELIEDAEKSGYKIVLMTPPYTKQYVKNFDKKWLTTNFNTNINILKKKFDIPYLNYSQAEYLQYDGLFRDPHHLNIYGKTIFSRVFLDSLNSIGYLKSDIALPKEIEQYRNFKINDSGLVLKKLEKITIDNKDSFIFLFDKNLSEAFIKDTKFIFEYNNDSKKQISIKNKKRYLILKANQLVNDFNFYFQ